jgi:beta-alanine degradation protein BauB
MQDYEGAKAMGSKLFITSMLVFSGCARTAPSPGGTLATGSPSSPPSASWAAGPTSSRTDSVFPGTSDPASRDPIRTDGDKYRTILENDRVRVLRYRDRPGETTKPHFHPAFVLYALAPFRRRLTFPDRTTKERDFQTGDVIYMPAQTHIGHNIGKTDTEAVIVELKGN